MRSQIAIDIAILLFALFIYYSISYTSLDLSQKSPANQRDQSFVFPLNFSKTFQAQLYSKFIYLILDGVTYDFVDSRVQNIPNSSPECSTHTHQVPIFNELLAQSPESVVFQKLQIESPPKTEIKISTYLKGTNPTFFSMKIPEANPYQLHMQDSVIYQVGQSKHLQKNYGFLTYFLYNYIGYSLTSNQFALNPFYSTYEQLKTSDIQKNKEYMKILKSNKYDTLFIYEGIVDEVGHLEGMHTPDVLDAQKYLDSVIRGIVENMDSDAILLVTSDHGKNEAGSHFDCDGKDKKVCNSLLFAYTKNGFVQNDKFIQSLRRKEDDERISKQAGKYSAHESMISSTLSNLMNIPISQINSGRSLLELYPKSKFNNRLEMLQRILQDSFTTLEQQMQFFEYIQRNTNIFNQDEYAQIMRDIEEIENSLFYEGRDTIIYSEDKIEILIQQIVALQNQMQESIYNNKFYSYSLLVFGMVLSSIVILAILVKTFVNYVIVQRQFKLFTFIIISSGVSAFIYYSHDSLLLKYYGVILTTLYFIYQGPKKCYEKRNAILLVTFLILNFAISFSKEIYENQMYSMRIISTLCEMKIIILHSEKLVKENSGQMKFKGLFMMATILFAATDGVFHQLQINLASLFLNIAFYCLSLYNLNKLNFESIKQSNFKIDLMIINIFMLFLGTFLKKSNFEYCAVYYPIAIVSVYLFCDLIYSAKMVFNSFYAYLHIGILSGVLFQLFNLQENSYKLDFSLGLIISFYFPLLLIPLMFKYSNPNSDKQPSPIKVIIQELEMSNYIIVKDTQISNEKITQQEKQEEQQNQQPVALNTQALIPENLKDGLILFSAISILCSCLGQILIIDNQKIFAVSDDKFIFQSEYIMTQAIIFLVVNIFIR